MLNFRPSSDIVHIMNDINNEKYMNRAIHDKKMLAITYVMLSRIFMFRYSGTLLVVNDNPIHSRDMVDNILHMRETFGISVSSLSFNTIQFDDHNTIVKFTTPSHLLNWPVPKCYFDEIFCDACTDTWTHNEMKKSFQVLLTNHENYGDLRNVFYGIPDKFLFC